MRCQKQRIPPPHWELGPQGNIPKPVWSKSPLLRWTRQGHNANISTHTQLVTQLLIAKRPLREPESKRQTQIRQIPKEQRKISIRAGKNFPKPKAGWIAAVAAQILRLAPVIVGEVGPRHPNLGQMSQTA